MRTLFGIYQLLRISPWLLTAANPLRFEFVSHKLCRLVVPFALIGLILSSVFLSGLFYRLPLAATISVGALGALALVRAPVRITSRLADLALTFVLLNTAAIVAFLVFCNRQEASLGPLTQGKNRNRTISFSDAT